MTQGTLNNVPLSVKQTIRQSLKAKNRDKGGYHPELAGNIQPANAHICMCRSQPEHECTYMSEIEAVWLYFYLFLMK